MASKSTVLQELSTAIEARVAHHSNSVAVRNASHRHISGIAWQPDAVATSEQAFGSRDEYEVVTAQGRVIKARIAGRDAGTNVLVLRLVEPIEAPALEAGEARAGALVLSLGASVDGATTARLGAIHSVGSQWFSLAGGRIEQRVALDIRLRRTEEGGPVMDPSGRLIGMSTLGRPGEVLAIPTATLTRIVPQLLQQGRVVRGWLGLALQPVAIPDALLEAVGQSVGMMVMSTAESGPAATAGVKAGDIALTVDGVPLGGRRRLAAQLGEESVGKAVALRVIRAGEVVTIEVQVTARP